MKKHSFDSKDETLRAAKKLLKRFPKRKGWMPRVHENLGWHIRFEKRGNRLVHLYYYPEEDKFTCLIGSEAGGRLGWSHEGSSSDPMEVLSLSIGRALSVVEKDMAALRICMSALGDR